MKSVDLSQLLVRCAIAQAIFENYRHDGFYHLNSCIRNGNYTCYLVHSQEVCFREKPLELA